MKNICVYCGSSIGRGPEYSQGAVALGGELVKRNIGLVYGGAKIGIMGLLADTVLSLGGKVTGIIPEHLETKEIAHTSLTQLHIVSSMHDRKALMAKLSDGFIALPGGFGTLEELFEIITWSQLGFHNKPCGILNINQYFDDLLTFIDHTTKEKFVSQNHKDILITDIKADGLLNQFMLYKDKLTIEAK